MIGMESRNQSHENNSGSELCLACGLCCDGSLFRYGNLLSGEAELAIPAGFQVIDNREQLVFSQPCAMFKSGCCSLYQHWRPKVCGEYKCRLLNSRLVDKISLPLALDLVARARDQRQSLAKFFAGEPPTMAMVRDKVARLGEAGELARREQAEFLLQAATYEFLVQKYFLEGVYKGKKAADMKGA